ncbi:hypothetical protein [Streptomyces sp. NBC_00118]|uniref:hypothetical protein n=1 Tax=unclassified Streptomyces TaxID=2593676 RepID=UPI0030899750|nr:hypothetical protein OG518_24250 [Streptomyces sp. NBC_01397]
MDWRYDKALTAQIQRMDRAQRHQAAFLALRKLQAPLLDIEMPRDWGVDPAAVDSLLRCGAAQLDGEPDDAFQQAITGLSRAPLFESEVDPELAESFQLEAIGGWILVGEALGEMSEVQTDRIVILAREQAVYLDQCIDSTLTVVADEGLRERYLANAASRLRAYSLGYFATRNLEVEGRCHEAILAASAGGGLLTSEAGRELLNSCDNYSSEMVSALRAFPT